MLEEVIIRKAIQLKLNPTHEQEETLSELFEQNRRAVKFALKRIHKIRSPYIWVKTMKDKNCSQCKTEGINYIHKEGNWLCKKCYYKRYGDSSIRKLLMSTKNRKAEQHDMNTAYVAPDLSATEVTAAIYYAANTIYKSFSRGRTRRQFRITRDEQHLCKLKELIDDAEITIDNKKVRARVELPLTQRQRTKRFRHIKWSEFTKGKTLATINRSYISLKRDLDKLNARKIAQYPEFRGNSVFIWNSRYSLEDHNIHLTALRDNKKLDIPFIGIQAKHPKGRERLEKAISTLLNAKATHTEIDKKVKQAERESKDDAEIERLKKDRKKAKGLPYALIIRKGTREKPYYVFTVVVTIHQELPAPDENYNIIGIDRGYTYAAVAATLSGETHKPLGKPLFCSSESYIEMRDRLDSLRKAMTNKKNRIKKITKWGRRATNFGDTFFHTMSRHIVDYAAAKKPCIISVEDLKKIRARGKGVQRRRQERMLNKFAFRKLLSLLEYKANEEGIRIVRIPPEFTSQTCHACGEKMNTQRPYMDSNTGKENYALFHCNSCGKTYNADYNAAVNIAKAGRIYLSTNKQ